MQELNKHVPGNADVEIIRVVEILKLNQLFPGTY